MPKLKFTDLSKACLMILVLSTACESLVEVDQPRMLLTRSSVFDDDATATAAIMASYTQLSGGIGSGGYGSVTYTGSLSPDEFTLGILGSAEYRQFCDNDLVSTNSVAGNLWASSFSGIYLANVTIEGLASSTGITDTLKQQLIGEATFFRAFYHFYLVNLFGAVPYVTSTDYRTNGVVSRLSPDAVYPKIVADLLAAKAALPETYPGEDLRTRVNKSVATALLARVYLYMGDWVHAEEQASTVISKNSRYQLVTKLNDVFLKNSPEALWQLIPPGSQKYVAEGGIFAAGNGNGGVPILTDSLLEAFENGDQRKTYWITSGTDQEKPWSQPYKYKETYSSGTGAEYYSVFRLAEQYLIRAEARARLGKLSGLNSATSDLNVIRDRAVLSPTTAQTQEALLAAVAQERRVELFVEWGHRWLDLKRTGQAAARLSPIKAGWTDTDLLYPIPYTETQLNPNLPQNPGY